MLKPHCSTEQAMPVCGYIAVHCDAAGMCTYQVTAMNMAPATMAALPQGWVCGWYSA